MRWTGQIAPSSASAAAGRSRGRGKAEFVVIAARQRQFYGAGLLSRFKALAIRNGGQHDLGPEFARGKDMPEIGQQAIRNINATAGHVAQCQTGFYPGFGPVQALMLGPGGRAGPPGPDTLQRVGGRPQFTGHIDIIARIGAAAAQRLAPRRDAMNLHGHGQRPPAQVAAYQDQRVASGQSV